MSTLMAAAEAPDFEPRHGRHDTSSGDKRRTPRRVALLLFAKPPRPQPDTLTADQVGTNHLCVGTLVPVKSSATPHCAEDSRPA
jgi:hypothetical protein